MQAGRKNTILLITIFIFVITRLLVLGMELLYTKQARDYKERLQATIKKSFPEESSVLNIVGGYISNGQNLLNQKSIRSHSIKGIIDIVVNDKKINKERIPFYTAEIFLNGRMPTFFTDDIQDTFLTFYIHTHGNEPVLMKKKAKAEINGKEATVLYDGFTLRIPLKSFHVAAQDYFDYSVQFSIPGAFEFSLVPTGWFSDVTLHSNWESPSFFGRLPDLDGIHYGKGDFTAHYHGSTKLNFSELNFATQESSNSTIGINFYNRLTIPALVERVLKYGVFILAIGFYVLLLMEYYLGLEIHIIQRILYGITLTLANLFIAALSEILGFVLSYTIGVLIIIMMNSLYIGVILKNLKMALLLIGFLLVAYSLVLFLLFQERYAILIGMLVITVKVFLAMLYAKNASKQRGI